MAKRSHAFQQKPSCLLLMRYYLPFPEAIPRQRVGDPTITHPCATEPCGSVRLACVRHAASVRSEPGSNSCLKPVYGPEISDTRLFKVCFVLCSTSLTLSAQLASFQPTLLINIIDRLSHLWKSQADCLPCEGKDFLGVAVHPPEGDSETRRLLLLQPALCLSV